MRRSFLLALGSLVCATAAAPAISPPPTHTLRSADDVLADFASLPLKGIPPTILAEAHGVVILPRLVKAGFVFGGRGGHGVVLTRGRDGAWSGPTFVSLLGASIGFQVGVESADVILVFRTRESLDRLLAGKHKLTLGADAAVAAGPIGRQAEAGTDARLDAEIFSYARSRGLFAGVALNGAAIWFDKKANTEYAADKRPETGKLVADLLGRMAQMSTLASATKEPPVAAPVLLPPSAKPDRP